MRCLWERTRLSWARWSPALAGNAEVGVAPFVLMGVFSSTMQLRGRPGLEYSDAGLSGARRTESREMIGEEEVISTNTNSSKSISSIYSGAYEGIYARQLKNRPSKTEELRLAEVKLGKNK